MPEIDFTTYNVKELLEAKENIRRDLYPEQYSKLMAELEIREEEIQELRRLEDDNLVNFEKKALIALGYIQVFAAAILIIHPIASLKPSIPTWIFAITLASFSGFAGVTLLKEQIRWRWVSIVNQVLQLPTVAIGKIYVNYSGIAGLYGYASWREPGGIGITFDFNPGFRFLVLGNASFTGDYVAIDFLALFALVLLLGGFQPARDES